MTRPIDPLRLETPVYAPREYCRRPDVTQNIEGGGMGDVGFAAYVFSLGATLTTTILGREPYARMKTRAETLAWLMNEYYWLHEERERERHTGLANQTPSRIRMARQLCTLLVPSGRRKHVRAYRTRCSCSWSVCAPLLQRIGPEWTPSSLLGSNAQIVLACAFVLWTCSSIICSLAPLSFYLYTASTSTSTHHYMNAKYLSLMCPKSCTRNCAS